MTYLSKMKKLFKRKPSKKLVEAKMNEARGVFGYVTALVFTITMLFLSTTVNAQEPQTFEQLQIEVNSKRGLIVGQDFGGFIFTDMRITDDRVFYMEMKMTQIGPEVAAFIKPEDKLALRRKLLISFANDPSTKAQMIKFNMTVRLVVLLNDGSVFVDETVRAEDIPSNKYY